jgi:hypothetical protein
VFRRRRDEEGPGPNRHFLLAEPRLTLTADAGALPEDLARRFTYDASRPLDETLTLLYERDDARTYDVVYTSPKGGKVTGFVVTGTRQPDGIPAGSGSLCARRGGKRAARLPMGSSGTAPGPSRQGVRGAGERSRVVGSGGRPSKTGAAVGPVGRSLPARRRIRPSGGRARPRGRAGPQPDRGSRGGNSAGRPRGRGPTGAETEGRADGLLRGCNDGRPSPSKLGEVRRRQGLSRPP